MKKTEALGAAFRMSGRGAGRAENLRLTANKRGEDCSVPCAFYLFLVALLTSALLAHRKTNVEVTMRRNLQFELMAAALGLSALYGTPAHASLGFRKLVSSKKPRRAWVKPHDGEQERARRRRQIAKGQITASNGLVSTVTCEACLAK